MTPFTLTVQNMQIHRNKVNLLFSTARQKVENDCQLQQF